MDRDKAKKLQDEIRKALDEVAKRNGITITLGTVRFSAHDLRARIEARDQGGQTKEARAFVELAEMYGLRSTDLGRTFHRHGEVDTVYKVIGLLPRARKTPILVEANGGVIYKMSSSGVKSCLEFEENLAAEATIGIAPKKTSGG
jgi:hypothetical protein